MTSTESPPFGELLRRSRRALGLTQEELAERAGVSARLISALESDASHRPRKDTLRLLVEALGFSAEEKTAFMAAARPVPAPTGAVSQDRAEQANGSPSSIQTFLVADIRNYTRFTEDHGDEAAAQLTIRFAQLVEEVVRSWEGRVVETRGDEVLVAFSSARQALRAAAVLQSRCASATQAQPDLPLLVGVAVDAGEAVPVADGYRGRALNLAARLCALAGPEEVFVTRNLMHLAGKIKGLAYIDRGDVQIKGLKNPIRVFHVTTGDVVPENVVPLQDIPITHPTNLPDEVTPFIGRAREIADITDLVRLATVRLVTLTGPGGTGKTRLALQVSSRILPGYPDGVFLVSMGPLIDPALVPSAIAGVLGIKEEREPDLVTTLTTHLKEKQVLLVLDNFEHLLDACSVVAELLDACRHLDVLVTSRSPLHLLREHEYMVPSLALPDTMHLPIPDQLSQYDAVALFIERARAIRADFRVTDANAPAVVEICHRLDGLPLAIELAAARIRLFPPRALLHRLSSCLKLLTGGARDQSERHQTLRNTIDWSYSLLSQTEQTIFARLSVFVGGCGLEAAESVCNPEGEFDLLEEIDSLVAHSVLRQEGTQEPRFRMLETIREYAVERLTEGEEREKMHQRHAAYFLTMAEEAEPELRRPQQAEWLSRLEQDHDNLRAALRWLQQSRDADRGLRLAAALGRFWELQGHLSEGRRWLDAQLALLPPLDASPPVVPYRMRLRVAALNAAALLAVRQQSEDLRVRALAESSVVLARSCNDVPGLIDALIILASQALVPRFALEESATLASEAEVLARSLHDDWRLGRALFMLGLVVYYQGDTVYAATLWEESVERYRACGDPTGWARSLTWLGALRHIQGELSQGVRYLKEALDLLGQTQSFDRSSALLNLAEVRADQGAYGEAEILIDQAFAISTIIGAPSQAARGQRLLAGLALEQGQVERAERLLEDAMQRAQAAEAPSEVVLARLIQGQLLTYRERYNEAEVVYRETLKLVEPVGIPLATAEFLLWYGDLARRQGQPATAAQRLQQALMLVDGKSEILRTSLLRALGNLAVDGVQLDEAWQLHRENLSMERAMGRPRAIAETLESLMAVAVAKQRMELAVRLGAAATRIRTVIGAPRSPQDAVAGERLGEVARTTLGNAVFDAVRKQDQYASWETIVDELIVAADGAA